jgi:hypothetical protein
MILWNQIIALFKKQTIHFQTTPFLFFSALLGTVLGAVLSIVIFGAFRANILDKDTDLNVSSALFYYYPNTTGNIAMMENLPTRRGFDTRLAAVKYTLDNYDKEIQNQPNFAHVVLESVGNVTSYSLVFNFASEAKSRVAMQMLIENAILGTKMVQKQPMSATWSFFKGGDEPPAYVAAAGSLADTFLPALMAFGCIPLLLLFINIVAAEKQQKTLGLLRRLGLRESAFWSSLFILSFPICFFSSLFGTLTIKYASPVDMYSIRNAEMFPLFLIQFLFSMCMVGYAIVWSSFISRPLFINLFTALMIFTIFPLSVYFISPGNND